MANPDSPFPPKTPKVRYELSTNDRRFLRSIRVLADEPTFPHDALPYQPPQSNPRRATDPEDDTA